MFITKMKTAMENQDKLYEQFKGAAGKAERKGFDRMEAVWNRVEEKLDRKKKRKGAILWRYGSIAAVLLILLALGGRFFNNHQPVLPEQTPETQVTTIDYEKVEETFNPESKDSQAVEAVVVNDDINKNNTPKNPQHKYITIGDEKINLKSLEKHPVGDTIYFQNGAKGLVTNDKKVRIWESKSDMEEFRIKAGVTAKKESFNSNNESNKKRLTSPKYFNNVASADEGYYSRNKKSFSALENKAEESNIESATDIEDRANASVIQSLQGQVAGLNIATGSGQPGSDSTIILRGTGTINGNAEPLFVVDGIPVDEDGFRSLNHSDIASFSILKDAAATSIYGNRGANGVIVITTKNANLSKKELRKLKRERRRAKKEEAAQPEAINFMEFQPVNKKIQIDQEDYEMFEENAFENPALAPLSTFSIDVDNASYTNVRRFLNSGQIVPKDAVRVEEMINFFKYSYPQPKGDVPFSINTEYSDAPWNPKHKLLKIGLKGVDIPTHNLPPSNFVFLIDVSGSMSDNNKLPLLKKSMKLLVNQMRDKDRIAIVVYAGAAGLVLPSVSGSEKTKIIEALENLEAGGSTAGGAGIELAYKTAVENFIKGGNNRVILATDGDFNVGASSDRDMETLIEEKRKSGVFLTCLGFGMGNYKDSKMEILADKGNGNYAYIDNMQEADRFLQKEFKGSMFAIAKDVKIQIEFNPKHVQSYRLIGYENRKLRDEDFVNDAIDAGELGSGHTVTALYEIIPVGVKSDYFTPAPELKYSQPVQTTGSNSDELATIKFRHKKPDGDKSTENVRVIENKSVSLQQASGDFKFAAAVAWFGLKLRDSKLIPNKTSQDIIELAKQGSQYDPDGYRTEFIRLVNMVE